MNAFGFTPLCPDGHLPLKGGDHLPLRSPPSSDVAERAWTAKPLISPLEGEIPDRAEGGTSERPILRRFRANPRPEPRA
ncbi:hypothetical protein BSQ44_20985 [Aquibium oceanicum]|uniref:Lytic murein transglycosylase n=1 Tax=Aquibium oceanicum TaxID=1670800 RepID=A0A1L3SW70_9HYPH|nr:hypothetical protein BSQ44_20985 [Aquibium oceanicum]